jgi:SOS-response transcriptional repressor LexA
MLHKLPLGTVEKVGRGDLAPLLLLNNRAYTTDDTRLYPIVKRLKNSYRIADDSLIGDRILKGDSLECDYDILISDVKPHLICLVYVFPSGFCCFKHIQVNHNNTVTLKASNPAYRDATFTFEEVEVLAIARRVKNIRDLPP